MGTRRVDHDGESTGETYYVNQATDERTWDRPVAAEASSKARTTLHAGGSTGTGGGTGIPIAGGTASSASEIGARSCCGASVGVEYEMEHEKEFDEPLEVERSLSDTSKAILTNPNVEKTVIAAILLSAVQMARSRGQGSTQLGSNSHAAV